MELHRFNPPSKRVHRLINGEETMCPKCKFITSERTFGVCTSCGWRDEAVAKRGLAPCEYSKHSGRTKLINHKKKRRLKKRV